MNSIVFNFGFTFEGKIYGWHNDSLYRLPGKIGDRDYGFIKCAVWNLQGLPYGFYLGSRKKSTKQILSMVGKIDPVEVFME